MVQKVIVFVLIVGLVNAVMYQENLPKIPDHLSDKQGCFLRDLDIVLPFNTVIPRPHCTMIECLPDAMVYTKCDRPRITDSRCKIVDVKPGQMYPECCQRVICV